MSRKRLVLAVAAAALAVGARAQSSSAAIAATRDTATPLQRGLRATLEQRAAAGLPVPASAKFTYEVVEGAPPAAEGALRALSAAETGRTVSIVSRTVLAFDGPEQAGLDLGWPRLVVRSIPGVPVPVDLDYTEAYRAHMEEQAPGFWQAYEFGHEPRSYTIVETTTVSFPEGSTAASALAQALRSEAAIAGPTAEQILLGFTYAGPHIDHTISAYVGVPSLCLPWWLGGLCTPELELLDFEAGFRLDWGFGLRLPVDVGMSGPLQLVSGSSGTFYADAAGADWNELQYASTGVVPYAGNEFVLKLDLFAGVKAEVLGIDACTAILGFPCYVEIDEDRSKTFATPFGTSAYFPIDALHIPLYSPIASDDLTIEFGLSLQPNIGSDQITATGVVAPGRSTKLSGPAALTFREPGVAVGLAVDACIVAGESREASVELRDFRYWFSRFLVELGIYGSVSVIGYTYDIGAPVYTFDLSKLFDNTFSLPSHVQCSATFSCGPAGPDGVVSVGATVVDVTPPETTHAFAGVEGKESWYRSDVAVTLTATDYPAGCDSGVASTEYWLDGVRAPYAGPFVVPTEGNHPLQFGSTDRDNVAELPQKSTALKIDKTKPVVVAAATPAANGYGWNAQAVTVHFTATDALSGVDPATLPADVLRALEGANQSASGSAKDLAGNEGTVTLTGINIDLTPPTLDLTSPAPGSYPNVATITVAWTANADISGLATESATFAGIPVASGDTVQLLFFKPMSYDVSVQVMDKAEHVVGDTVTLDVTVDLPGLLAALEGACAQDWINKLGICNSLEAKVLAAIASRARGDLPSTAGQLGAFVNELDAQWDKAINSQGYELLRADAQYVLGHL